MQRIVHPPSREEFEKCIRSLNFYPEAIEMVLEAWDWCVRYHEGEPRREDGSKYAHHPQAAAWILLQEIGVTDPETIALALLHDIGEIKHMTPPTHQEFCQAFNYRIAHKVIALTIIPGQSVEEYSRQFFSGGTKVVLAKFADRLHNLRTLGACPQEKQDRKISDTWMYFYPDTGNYKKFFDSVSPKDQRMINRLWLLMAEAMNELLATREPNTRG